MHRRNPFRHAAPFALLMACACVPLAAQRTSDVPVVPPANVVPEKAVPPPPVISERDKREADNAYLQGARQISKHDFAGAEANFARATVLNPTDPTYARARAYARESRVMELVHAAAQAKVAGNVPRSKELLAQAHELDPQNNMVAQHLSAGGDAMSPAIDPLLFPASDIASTLAGAPQLKPTPGTHDFHIHSDPQSALREVYSAFGIKVQFDPSVSGGAQLNFDINGLTFDAATSFVHQLTKTFAAPVQNDLVIIAQDSQDNRDRLVPQVEETIYLRGMTSEQMQDLANLARNVFDVKNITASATGGTILVRADEPTLKLLNAQYADMLDGDSDVLMDVSLYEIDKSKVRNFGVSLAQSATAYDLASEAQNIITANQATIDAAKAAGLFIDHKNTLANTLEEIGIIEAAGGLTATQTAEISGLLGYIGSLGGFPLLGVSVGSGATVNAVLTASDVRVLDSMQLRAANSQKSQFRSGTRYPIITSTYSSGVTGLSPALQAAATAAGISTTSVTIPNIQFEDLGLTLVATPHILRTGEVNIALDLKIISLGSVSLNSIPELNNRQYVSTVTVPAGQSAMLASVVNKSELGSVSGFPGLNDLPGFQGTNKDLDREQTELLIVVTPHVVRQSAMRFTSRRLAFPHVNNSY